MKIRVVQVILVIAVGIIPEETKVEIMEEGILTMVGDTAIQIMVAVANLIMATRAIMEIPEMIVVVRADQDIHAEVLVAA
jgi:hypothetical protein